MMNFKFSNKLSDFIWINGEIIPWEEANIHVLTHSLHYSGAVYEGMRAYEGKVFKLLEHTNRLLNSARTLHLKVNYSADEIIHATNEILKINNFKDAYVRPLIWRGAESLNSYTNDLSCHILILASASSPPFKNQMRLCVTPWRKIGPESMPPQCKSSAHYAIATLSKKLAQDGGFDDALMLDQYDEIAETPTANIFFGKNNMLITPIADRFLNGITRQTVIEIARNIGIKVIEERLSLDDLEKYDTCFITGTAAEISGVSLISYDNTKVEFKNNDLVLKLQLEYAKITGKTI